MITWFKKNQKSEKILDLTLRIEALEDANKSLSDTVIILSRRIDKHVYFIDALSKTNSSILDILDISKTPKSNSPGESKFLGFDFKDDKEEK